MRPIVLTQSRHFILSLGCGEVLLYMYSIHKSECMGKSGYLHGYSSPSEKDILLTEPEK